MTMVDDMAQTQDNDAALRVRALGIRGRAGAIADAVEFDVQPGEAIAIVGESGSGKSLTARAVIDLLPAGVQAAGEVALAEHGPGTLGASERRRARGRELALVMQDPFTMLNPLERSGDQIVEPLGLRGRAREEEAVRRLAEVGISDPAVARRYPFELSGGMRQRVGIACAIAQNPRVLIADEPTTALDVTTQREILELLGSLRRSHDMGLVLITHDLRVAFSVCDRVYVMYAGTVVESGAAAALETAPRHPYTLGLLLADPPLERRVARLPGIPGSVPAPGHRPPGCPFAPRCEWSRPACEMPPEPRGFADGGMTRCVRIDEIGRELTVRRARTQSDEVAAVPAEAGEALVVAEHVEKTFAARGRGAPTMALAGVSIEIRAGESVGLVGESGSGKTTLGRTIVGLERPSAGTVRVGDVVLPARGAREHAVVRSTVQMAFQDPYSTLHPSRTVGATLREALRLGGQDAAGVPDLLALVGLPVDYAARRPAVLSGGERQRVAIARALARRPRVVVCDEVVSALDVSVQAQILGLLRSLREEIGLSYLFITHDLAVVRQVTDRLYVMCRGEIVESGSTDAVLDDPQHPYTRRLLASVPRRGEDPTP